MKHLSLSMIQEASKIFRQWFLPTPIEYSPSLSTLLKAPVIFKCEHFQPSGSYKLRGVYYILSKLTDQEKKQGVCAFDNHNSAISLAYAAQLLNIPCSIYLSKSPSPFFEKKLIEYHANIELCPFTDDTEALSWIKAEAKKEGKIFICSYDDERLMAANGGTLSIELLKDIPQLKNVIVPIGQGDLIGGLLFFLKKKYPDIVIIGCQYHPSTQDHLLSHYNELCGTINEKAQTLIDKYLDHKCSINEEDLLKAHKWLLKEHHSLIEPAAAITIAACLSPSLPTIEGPTAVILSGKSFEDDFIKQIAV